MKSHDKIIMPKSRLKIFIPVAVFITLLRSSLPSGRAGNAIKIAQPLKILPEVLVRLARLVYNNYYLIIF